MIARLTPTGPAADPIVHRGWHVVAASSDVSAGELVKRNLLGEDLILWRNNDTPRAWQDLCIHRGVRLSLGKIVDGCKVQCAYHGWTYNETGVCTHIPAHPSLKPPPKARVRTYACAEAAGMIWVSLSDNPGPLPWLPELDNPTCRQVRSGPYPVAAGVTRMIENFLDVAHLPFIHEGYLGTPDQAEIDDYEVTALEDGLFAADIGIFQPNPDGSGKGAKVFYDYGVLNPFCVYLRKKQGDKVMTLLYAITPVDEAASIGWFVTMMNYAHEVPESEIAAFQDTIISQDKPIVESQRPERVPLDLAEELHLRSDRLAIAYRQYLRKLGLSFGTE